MSASLALGKHGEPFRERPAIRQLRQCARSMAGNPTFEMKMSRIMEQAAAANRDDLSRNLLHAYTACLPIEELCEAAVRTFNSELSVRRAILTRLLRIGGEKGCEEQLDQLGSRLLGLSPAGAKERLRIDALLSQLYAFFSPPTRQIVLERWRSRGTIGAGVRWLKAISSDTLLFEINAIVDYWRATGDARAAKLLAYRGDAPFLANLLPELVERCQEGWIVSRAALNAGLVSDACWEAIRGKFPATYAYLCAKVGRPITEAEALDLVRESGASWPADDRGLAIWALGQLGMWSALEQIRMLVPDFHAEDLAKMGLQAS